MKHSFSIIFKSLTLLALSLLVFSCNKNSFTIDGTSSSPTASNTTLYLFNIINENLIDSATFADNKISFSGKADSAILVGLFPCNNTNSSQPLVVFFLEPGKIHIDFDSSTVTGTPLNDDFQSILSNPKMKEYNAQCQALENQHYTAASEEEYIAIAVQYDSIATLRFDLLKNLALDCYNNHPDDILGAYTLLLAAQAMPFAQFDSIMQQASPFVKSFPPLNEAYTSLTQLQLSQPGNHFIEIQGTDFASQSPASLSSYINGHIAIIDFWASWCNPCCQEIKDHLIPLYNKYQSQGVVIVGIDINDKPQKHADMVAQLGIPYPQLIDSRNTASQSYALTSIPQIILIDQNGTIIARDLRGDKIELALNQLLKSK